METQAAQKFSWAPNPGPQTAMLRSRVYEVLFGGAAGGGKSETLLMGALRHVGDPRDTGCGCPDREIHRQYKAILFRRTFPELQRSLIARSEVLYKSIEGADYNQQNKVWKFPGGETIFFGHLEHEGTVHEHQSAEYQFIGFDELTSFMESQYLYMMTRARSSSGIPIQIRAASNPGGVGHSWVFKRFEPWLNPKHKNHVGPGVKLSFLKPEDEEERIVPHGTLEALTRVFIPSKLSDNPMLTINDPGYHGRLNVLDNVTRRQLQKGDWLATPAKGEYFKRFWWKFLPARPREGVYSLVRYWDLAATEKKKGNEPDWVVGTLMGRLISGAYVIIDVVRFRGTPHEVDSAIETTAKLDGHHVRVKLPQDPGSAGKHLAALQVSMLAGYWATSERETGDKVTRAGPYSAQVQAGNFYLVEAPWNEEWIKEHEQFPEGVHDDQVDSGAGAFKELTPEGYDLRKIVQYR